MSGTPAIVAAHPAHADAVSRLLEECFKDGEANLVRRLVADGDAVYSLGALVEGELAGHVMFSKMAKPEGTLGLGPVAVSPAHHRRGMAESLVRHGISLARADGWQGIFVLGDPGYYARFGFDPALAAPYSSPYAGPHLMGLKLKDEPLPLGNGALVYAPAFAAL